MPLSPQMRLMLTFARQAECAFCFDTQSQPDDTTAPSRQHPAHYNKPMGPSRWNRALPGYAAFVLAFMVLVILEGAVVRATGSGAGCGNHWPLCNGQLIPHHPRLTTVIEFTHRSLTGICTTLTLILIAWTFLARPQGHRARRAAAWSGLFLLTEAALGAVLVLGGYTDRDVRTARDFVQGIHFTNTMLLLAAFTLTWWFVRDDRPSLLASEPSSLAPAPRALAWIAILATLLTGATGAIASLADTLFPSPSFAAALASDFSAAAPLLIRMRWIHPASAILTLACALLLCRHLPGKPAQWLLSLIALQFTLGIADVRLLAPTWLQVLHLLVADLYWIALIATCSGLFTNEAARTAIPAAEPLHSVLTNHGPML
jgi:cytochrome c oxidase assembly protein subunit 15